MIHWLFASSHYIQLYVYIVDLNHVGVAIKISIPIIDTELDLMDCTCNVAKECTSHYWAVRDFKEQYCTHLYTSLHIAMNWFSHLYRNVWESSSTDVCQIGVPTTLLLQLQLTSLWLQMNNYVFYFFCFLSVWMPFFSGMILVFKNSEASALRTRDVKSLCFPSTSAFIFKNGYLSVATLYYIFCRSTNHCMAASMPKFGNHEDLEAWMHFMSVNVDGTLSEVPFEDSTVTMDEFCSCDTLCTTEADVL